jgi:hypothetical protein
VVGVEHVPLSAIAMGRVESALRRRHPAPVPRLPAAGRAALPPALEAPTLPRPSRWAASSPPPPSCSRPSPSCSRPLSSCSRPSPSCRRQRSAASGPRSSCSALAPPIAPPTLPMPRRRPWPPPHSR